MPVVQATSGPEWEAVASQSFVPLSVVRVAPRLTASVDHRVLHEDVSLCLVTADSGGIVRRTSRLIDDSPDEWVIFTIQLGGWVEISQDGRQAALPAGGGAFIATDRPYALDFPHANRELEVQVSRERLGFRADRLRQLTATPIGAADPSLRVLTAYARALFDIPEAEYDLDEQAMFGRVTGDLLTTLINKIGGRCGTTPSSVETYLARAKQAIARDIGDPDLDVAALAARLNVSARTIHTAFAMIGTTPASYIRQERLAAAARRIQTSQLPLAEIAYEVGFADTTTFTRAFKRVYGATPSTWRRSRT